MFMAKSINDEEITAMGDTIEEVWRELQFAFELTDDDFLDLEWFRIEPIKTKRILKFVIDDDKKPAEAKCWDYYNK